MRFYVGVQGEPYPRSFDTHADAAHLRSTLLMIMEVEPEDVCIVRSESSGKSLEIIQAWHAQREREKEGGTDALGSF